VSWPLTWPQFSVYMYHRITESSPQFTLPPITTTPAPSGRRLLAEDDGWGDVGGMLGGGERDEIWHDVMAVVSVGVNENEEGVEGMGEWAAAGEVEKGLGGGAPYLRGRRLLSQHDKLSLTFEVSHDYYGKDLKNTQEYKFRLTAMNTFNQSIPSEVISVTPVGTTPSKPMNFSAICQPPDHWEVYGPIDCVEPMRGYSEKATLSFRQPLDDGGIEVLEYVFESSEDDGGTWVVHDTLAVAELTPDGTGLMTHTFGGLENGKTYTLAVAAVNFYGEGEKAELQGYVPTDCPNLEECKVCVESFYHIWGNQCEMPPCVLEAKETHDHRMVDCTEGHGCRLEILHKGEWGTIEDPKNGKQVGQKACEQFGFRGRPDNCGHDAAACKDGSREGALTNPTPAAEGSKTWMTGIDCNNGNTDPRAPPMQEINGAKIVSKIHHCSGLTYVRIEISS